MDRDLISSRLLPNTLFYCYGLKKHKWLKKYIKIIFNWAKYLIKMPRCRKKGSNIESNDLNRPEKAQRID